MLLTEELEQSNSFINYFMNEHSKNIPHHLYLSSLSVCVSKINQKKNTVSEQKSLLIMSLLA